jgi:pimeloyl-ACP methyl ester carboxylesterase
MIAFLEKLEAGPVDVMGHSRGGHVSFRLAQRRPDLLRRLILAEPGGELDATLDPDFKPGPSRWPRGSPRPPRRSRAAMSTAD